MRDLFSASFLFIHVIICAQNPLKAQDQNILQLFMPTTSSDCNEIIDYNFYSVSFCENFGLSEWAIYILNINQLDNRIPRTNDFRPDPNLHKRGVGATMADYKGSGFDRGHLVPAADMKYGAEAMSESFYLTNIVPQYPAFNRGDNNRHENIFRDWAWQSNERSIIVIVGWNTNDNFTDFLHGGNIPVPKNSYRIYIDYVNFRAIAFYVPSVPLDRVPSGIKATGRNFITDRNELITYTISIDSLETITGLDFFHKLSDEEEMLLELDTGRKKPH